ncbi:hypothetical protein M514_10523 [Trichuris suis]|uniref:Uncharacterized protein n=1 Tax=Trichuris suis TaxID=68888 RepID=A0A085N3D4_9BILA|nr:hypothetical protein M513_10523 [Trichuris suis]KFD63980.1 hypothetical protein M514_10523 [Trichuris suis]
MARAVDRIICQAIKKILHLPVSTLRYDFVYIPKRQTGWALQDYTCEDRRQPFTINSKNVLSTVGTRDQLQSYGRPNV